MVCCFRCSEITTRKSIHPAKEGNGGLRSKYATLHLCFHTIIFPLSHTHHTHTHVIWQSWYGQASRTRRLFMRREMDGALHDPLIQQIVHRSFDSNTQSDFTGDNALSFNLNDLREALSLPSKDFVHGNETETKAEKGKEDKIRKQFTFTESTPVGNLSSNLGNEDLNEYEKSLPASAAAFKTWYLGFVAGGSAARTDYLERRLYVAARAAARCRHLHMHEDLETIDVFDPSIDDLIFSNFHVDWDTMKVSEQVLELASSVCDFDVIQDALHHFRYLDNNESSEKDLVQQPDVIPTMEELYEFGGIVLSFGLGRKEGILSNSPTGTISLISLISFFTLIVLISHLFVQQDHAATDTVHTLGTRTRTIIRMR